ncbi:hypothetical protein ACFYQ5_28175 [Streptomyces sp. NPDC005794]|uniref:hypothetical protein n=1 Tax=Streptomyces sp. NPDC005794 TaxID=3364733 RepID=UPI0036BB1B5C
MELGGNALPVLELHGPIETIRIEAALDTIATRHPDAPTWTFDLESRGPGQHTLRLTDGADGEHTAFPLRALADLLTHGARGSFMTRRLAATPLQRELLADADAHPDPDRQVEQAAWDWHGPLDVARFTAAWCSVFAHESVLRTAFDDQAEPEMPSSEAGRGTPPPHRPTARRRAPTRHDRLRVLARRSGHGGRRGLLHQRRHRILRTRTAALHRHRRPRRGPVEASPDRGGDRKASQLGRCLGW